MEFDTRWLFSRRFPLTLSLSLPPSRRAKAPLRRDGGREGEQPALRSGQPSALDCSPRRAGFTLSPRERAGVRGNGPLQGAAGIFSIGCATDRARLYGFEPLTISSLRGILWFRAIAR